MKQPLQDLQSEAQKYIENPDVIIDVYDMTYAWVSQKHVELTGYSLEEQIDMRIDRISKLVDGDTSQMAPEALKPNVPFTRDMILTSKNGETTPVTVSGIVVDIDNHPYLIGKMLSV